MRVAVITGGSSGIGEAVARTLSKRDWSCVLLARNRERLERVAGEVGAEWEQCDVGDREQVDEVARQIRGRHPALQLLVNNAGFTARKSFLELAPERIEELVRTNYLGGVWCVRAFLPLLEAGAPSDVVNVASVAGTVAYGASGPYSASKHAQLAFSRNVVPKLARYGVRVHTVNPGPVQTPGFPQERLLANPWGRRFVLWPDEVAARIVRAVERDQPEIALPRTLRLAAAAQSLFPATLARIARRTG
jgi:NAD(P)-dependent dehydrogenase (short-subunit alcohol dehydrogenase family)